MYNESGHLGLRIWPKITNFYLLHGLFTSNLVLFGQVVSKKKKEVYAHTDAYHAISSAGYNQLS